MTQQSHEDAKKRSSHEGTEKRKSFLRETFVSSCLRGSALIAPAIFALLTFAMFFDVLFANHRVVSADGNDLALQFIPWREFGFSQLRQGNLALWNPHIYGGAPYFAGFQSALLYPPNWLHLVLPIALAINWIVALHIFAAGYFTYLWCRGRSIGIGGAILAGVMFMFSGPYFLHLYAGHLPHLAVMVWTPLMLLSLDKLADTGNWRWTILGIVATSMQILAGHPQYVYYTGIALTIYLLVRLLLAPGKWRVAIGGFVIMYLSAIAVTAIQLLPGIAIVGELVRSGGTSFKFASTFSLPPENLVTFLAPTFLGTLSTSDTPINPYWAAGYLWEMSLFVSVSGLVLAALGAIRRPQRPAIIALIMVGVTMLLALGRHTLLYRPMFELVPQYSTFRGTVKFAYLAILFIALLAGMGFDGLLRDRRVNVIMLLGAGTLALVVGIAGLLLPRGNGWADFMRWIVNSAREANEMFLPTNPADMSFVASSRHYAALACYVAAGTLALTLLALWASRFARWVPYSLILLATAEMFVFARSTRATMNPEISLPPAWKDAVAKLPRDQRILTVPRADTMQYADRGMALDYDNLMGYDPAVFKRYAELIFASQGLDPASATQYLAIRGPNPPVFRMLRCGLVCVDPMTAPISMPRPLPIASLLTDWVQLPRPQALAYVVRNGFDPASRVVLESKPDVQPVESSSPPGTVNVISQTTDSIELVADLQSPAILLVTDNYSQGWRVVPVEKSSQPSYRIMPANYTQIGIPLEPGRHHIRLEYSPASFRIGRWISGVSIFALLIGSFLLMGPLRRFR